MGLEILADETWRDECVECGCSQAVHVDYALVDFVDFDVGKHEHLTLELPVPWCPACEQYCSGTFDPPEPDAERGGIAP